jgi:predicted N-acyltransferase
MSFDVQIAHSVEEVGQETWDRLSGDRPFASYRWYRFGERAMAYAQPIYVLLFGGNEPVARATFWLTPRELIPMQPRVVRHLLESMLRRWPLLICQSPLTSAASCSGLILPEPPLRDEALRVIARVARDLGSRHRISFAIFGYLEEHEARGWDWPEDWAPTVMWGSGTRMEVTWPDFESYLADLGKKRRYNIRRNLRLGAEVGIEIAYHPDVEDIEKAMALHSNVNRRHRAPTEPWMRGAMEHAHMVDSAWLTASVDGRLVGCELMLGDRGVWLVTGLGLDYSVDYAYFMLGYADIQCAIERGAKMLRWGSLAYEVKRRLGFELESNDWVVFSARGGLLQGLGRWLATMEEGRYRDEPAS